MKWDLDYLDRHMEGDSFSVYESDSHLFKYFDEKKISTVKNFKPEMSRSDMSFSEFVGRMKNWKHGQKK